MTTGPTIWAFDLGKASFGEAVRDACSNNFLHVESLLIPAELARRGPATASGSPANRYRALKTREAHHAREKWLETVWAAAGLEPLRGRQVAKAEGKWRQIAKGDPRLEREFAAKGDNTCYTSCLLRIRLLLGDGSLEEWQIYKALRSALQRRGYGKVPWASKEARRQGVSESDLERQQEELAKKDPRYRDAVETWPKFRAMVPDAAYRFPCYFDAWKMGLWNPAEPTKHRTKVDHLAGSTRNVRFDRADVRKELIRLGDEAARILPAVRDAFARWQRDGWTYKHPVTRAALTYPMRAKSFGEFLCDGPAGTPDESSFEAFLMQRKNAGLRIGTFEEWMAALGQKTPKFDNRILNDCVLIPRFHVCKVDVRLDTKAGQPVPESLLATEVTFLLKLKNLLVADAEKGQRKLTVEEVRAIFAYAHQQLKATKLISPAGELAKNWPGKVADCFGLTKSAWGRKKGLAELELKPLPGHEEVKAPKTSGRSAYSRVALRILKELILSGDAPSVCHARLLRREQDLLRRLGSTPDKPLFLMPDSTAKDESERNRENTDNQKRGVLVSELYFLLQMRKADAKADSWDNLFVPTQTLDALMGRHTEDGKLDSEAAIRELLGTVNDPIVRHRLGVFSERLKLLQIGNKKAPGESHGFGVPESIVLEFVREDFMGDRALTELRIFQKRREEERKEAKEMASAAGATSGLSALKYQLWKSQGGECLYGSEVFDESGGSRAKCLYHESALPLTRLDDYVIDHIVPRAQGGPDAMVNYVLTTQETNEAKGDRTPFEWLHASPDWDAYKKRVEARATMLRNKKVQLLTREDAPELVQRYTALAETAWVSKLAQTIVNLRFGWTNGNDAHGRKRVIVVSGGLTARVRRKYDLNRLLHGDDTPIEEAEKKNRNDDRHHALDAMVLTFIPQWARDPGKEGFFRFPGEFRDSTGREDYGHIREHFRQTVAKVMPRNLVYERPALADTLYGARDDQDGKVIVQRVEVAALAQKPIGPQKTKFDLAYARDQVKSIRDAAIRQRLGELLATEPDEARWTEFCAGFRQLRENGSPGASITHVTQTLDKEPVEFKDMSKDGTGAFRTTKQKHRGQFVYLDNAGKPVVAPVRVFESVKAVGQAISAKANCAKLLGFFESLCLVEIAADVKHGEFLLRKGAYCLNSLRQDGRAELTSSSGTKSPKIPLTKLLPAGFIRSD